MPLINAYVDVSSKASVLNFGQCLHLDPYMLYASNEGSGESAHMLQNPADLDLHCFKNRIYPYSFVIDVFIITLQTL